MFSSSKQPGWSPGEEGFSILEVAIALAVLLTVLISVSSLMVTAFKVGADSRYRQAATEIAASTLDSEVQTGVNALLPDVGDTALSSTTLQGQTYHQELEISPYTPGSSACASPGTGLAMLKITVWVTWADVSSGTTWWVSGSSGSTGLLVAETTLLSLPSTAFNSSDGTILVAVTGVSGSGDGIEGVTVSATQGSTTETATTTESGCALFANLATGSWTVTISKTGYIDNLDDWSLANNASLAPSAAETVNAGDVTTATFTYDQEATVSPVYTVASVNGTTPWLPTEITTLPLSFYTNSLTTNPYVALSPAKVFPFVYTTSPNVPSYYVVAGSCGAQSSPDGATVTGASEDGVGVDLTPGASATPSIALTPVNIVVSHNGTAVSGASISASVPSGDSSCPTGQLAMPTLGLGTSCVPGGSGPTSCTVLSAYRRTKHHGREAILVSTSTTTTITSSLNPSTYDSSVTFTAVVSRSSGSGTPTGSVSFTEGGNAISSSCTTESFSSTTTTTGTATCTTSSLAETSGVTIKATYNAGSGFSTSSASLTQVVNTAPTTTTLTSSPNPNSYGTSATLTASVTVASPSTATPAGTFTYDNNGTAISGCSAVSLTSTCTLSGLNGGSYSITATFNSSNTTDIASSTSSTLSQSVTAASTSTSLTSSSFLGVSTSGASVTFTATVTAASGTVAGTVAFKSNGTAITNCTSQTVSSGVATCTTTSLAVGSDAITAVFTPTNSSNFGGSTGTFTQIVYLEGTTPAIETGLPYGSWTLTITYQPTAGGTTYTATDTLLINTTGIYVNGVLATASPIQLTD